jgi:hypothetical protein
MILIIIIGLFLLVIFLLMVDNDKCKHEWHDYGKDYAGREIVKCSLCHCLNAKHPMEFFPRH